MSYKYIFITGAGRCGTTLTRSLIDGHSKINVLPGELTNFLGVFLDESGFARTLNIKNNINALLTHFYGIFYEDPDYRAIKDKIDFKINELICSNKTLLSPQQLLSHICSAIFEIEKGHILIDITNENISGLLDEFPESKVIHLIRHPMDQMNSYYRLRFHNPNKRTSCPGMWEIGDLFSRIYRTFREAEIHRNNKRVAVFMMEDLQNKTDKIVRNICDFIGIEPEPINGKMTRRGQACIGSSTQIESNKLFVSEKDWSCLTSNDLYFLGKLQKLVKDFYNIPACPYKGNKYFTFLLRQLGFIGKNRPLPKSLFRIIKIILISFSEYVQDLCKKRYFEISLNILEGSQGKKDVIEKGRKTCGNKAI